MPPRDRYGLFICTCSICVEYLLVDRGIGEPERGCRVGGNQYTTHRRRQLAQENRTPPNTTRNDDGSLDGHQADEQIVSEITNESSPSTSTPMGIDTRDEAERFLESTKTILCRKGGSQYFEVATLVFSNPPQPVSMQGMVSPDLTLQADALDNLGLNMHCQWLDAAEKKIHSFLASEILQNPLEAQRLLDAIRDRKTEIREALLREWTMQQQRVSSSYEKYVVSTKSITRFQNYEPITFTCYIMVAILYLICGLSLDHCNFVLSSARVLINLLAGRNSDTARSLPSDFRTILDILELDPRVERFACCPRCYTLYEIDANASTPTYPKECTYREFPDSEPCGRKLRAFQRETSDKKDIWKATREMLYHDVKDWIADLYNRPDIEPYLDRQHEEGQPQPDREVVDIWDSPALRSFLGPDGKPFLRSPGNEGRLVFALNEDGINPFGNLTAGKTVTIGAIYLVCLNLPPALRYKKANMCLVAIIPGPSSPSRHQINHVLRPLVDSLKLLWHDGIFLARTCNHPFGRLVRAAVRILVCDLPAARQVAGLPHFAHTHFCHMCHQTIDQIRNFDFWTWHPRTGDEHKHYGEAWRLALTDDARQAIYKESGLRWSVLMELPYWNSIDFTVIDTMHCFFLRILPHHCRSIWGMDVELDDGNPLSSHQRNRLSEADMVHAFRLLQSGSNDDIEKLPMNTLRQLCFEAGLTFGGRRRAPLLKALLNYRVQQGWPTPIADEPVDTSPVTDTFTIQSALDLFNSGTKSAIDGLLKEKLVFMAMNVWPDVSKSVFYTMNRKDIANMINDKRQELGILDADLKVHANYKQRRTKKGTAVLGTQTLEEVRKDIVTLVAPSWFAKAPAHPGEAKWGKLTAGQWRAMCLVHLPITLIGLWGFQPNDTLHARMLVNFMHLITAISLATARTMNSDRIRNYEHHMHEYLRTLLSLYPGTEITPYQHLSLHLGPMLEQYGPTHGWRCYPFERANGELRNIPTNNKFGELEQTKLKKFCASQKLHSIMHDTALPHDVHDLLPAFARAFEADIQGKVDDSSVLKFSEEFQKVDDYANWTADDEVLLPPDLVLKLALRHLAQNPHRAVVRTHVKILGRRYESWKSPRTVRDRWQHGNSMVIFGRENKDWGAGQIDSIIQQRASSGLVITYFALDVVKSLSPEQEQLDPYRKFPPVGGRLFHREMEESRVVVPLDQVLGHCAVIPRTVIGITGACILVFPLP